MGRVHQKVGNRYIKRPEFCRQSGCHNPPAPNLKYCQDCLAKERAQSLAARVERRLEIMRVLGGVNCAVPGCPICDPLMLEIDHVNNDGAPDRKRHHTAYTRAVLRLCRENPEQARARFQVLCSGHNKQKEIYHARGWEWTLEIASLRLKQYEKRAG